jgi:predicted nucleotidyltransferase component of viral defense system
MNSPKSIRAKLMNLSKSSNIDFQSIITRYIHERILYRISKSEYKNNFILKGGHLLYAHFGLLSRPTVDIDFSGHEISNLPESLIQAFSKILEWQERISNDYYDDLDETLGSGSSDNQDSGE